MSRQVLSTEAIAGLFGVIGVAFPLLVVALTHKGPEWFAFGFIGAFLAYCTIELIGGILRDRRGE